MSNTIVGIQFQSPSLRGSGRFSERWEYIRLFFGFQSPSLRGSGRFSPASRPCWRSAHNVSIPFIAGQWSLPAGSGP